MRPTPVIAALVTGLSLLGPLHPADARADTFLDGLSGEWTGRGSVTRRIGAAPTRVSCRFQSQATPASLSLAGSCRGMLVVRRAIAADLARRGDRYSGTYVGPSGLPSKLSGTRRGETLRLAVRWNKPINGDRDATMTITRSSKGLVLRTLDRDPASGKTVETSVITLSPV